MLREGRELIPTAKAFQLMTLLRGLEVEELSRPALTGEWEHKLSLMERGQLSRRGLHARDRRHDRAHGQEGQRNTTGTACRATTRRCRRPAPTAAAWSRRTTAATALCSADGWARAAASFGKSPAGRTFEIAEAESFLAHKHIGPLEGFRSKAGWPFVAELRLGFSGGQELEAGVRLRRRQEGRGERRAGRFLGARVARRLPQVRSPVHVHGSNYVCSKAVPTLQQAAPSCDFKSGTTILQQEIAPEQMSKLLATGKTDLLEKFVSNKTKRAFKAFLAWDAAAGKVGFEFEPRESKYPPRKTAAAKKAPAKKQLRRRLRPGRTRRPQPEQRRAATQSGSCRGGKHCRDPESAARALLGCASASSTLARYCCATADDGQAQARAVDVAAQHAVEGLQHQLALGRRDAGAVVLDLQRLCAAVVVQAHTHRHHAAGRGVMDRVVDQVAHQLLQQRGIAQQQAGLGNLLGPRSRGRCACPAPADRNRR